MSQASQNGACFLLLGGLIACSEGVIDARVPEGAKSALVVVDAPRGVELFALDLRNGSAGVPGVDQDALVTRISFDRSLPELGIASGKVVLVDQGRALPCAPLEIARTRADLGDWQTLGVLPAEVAALRIEMLDPRMCSGGGGCLDSRPIAAGCDPLSRCSFPCPASEIREPRRPMAPAPPSFGECPSGWSPSIDPPACRPNLSLERCPPGEAAFADGNCVPLAAPCDAADDYNRALTGAEIFVHAAAPVGGGNGTRAQPFRTIAAAVAAGANRIALSKGTFDEDAQLNNGLWLIGACPAETILSRPVVAIRAGALASLSIRTSTHALVVNAGANVALEGVALQGAGAATIDLRANAALDARSILVECSRNTCFRAFGVARVERMSMLRGSERGLFVRPGGDVMMSDSVVIDPSLSSSGHGIATAGGALSLQAVAVRGGAGPYVEAGRITADQLYLSDLSTGQSLTISEGSIGVLSRVFIERGAHPGGVLAQNARATITDLVITDQSTTSTVPSSGVLAADGGVLQADRVWVARLEGSAMFVDNGTLEVSDVFVEDIGEYGLFVFQGGHAGVVRAHFTNTTNPSIWSGSDQEIVQSSISLSDVRIDGGPNSTRVVVRQTGTLTSSAVSIEGPYRVGLATQGRLLASDLSVIGAAQGMFLDGSTHVLQRVFIEGARHTAISIEAGARASISDLSLAGAADQGTGIDASAGGAATVERFVIRDQAKAIQLQVTGELDLSSGLVVSNGIPLAIDEPCYDLRRLFDRVVFEENASPNAIASCR